MYVISLTEDTFNKVSFSYNNANYKQTVNYAKLMKKYGYNTLYVGLMDNDKILACCLILEHSINSKHKIGYIPNGFLINYNDDYLFKIFTKELKKYLNKLNYIYVSLNPNFTYRIFNKNNEIISYYSNIIDNMKKLGYIKTNNKYRKYDAILNTDSDDLNNIYNKLNRNIKRKIKDSKLMELDIYMDNNIDKFYSIIMKKDNKNIDYYRYMNTFFNSDDISFEVYFARLNTESYLNNCRNLLNKEYEINEKLQNDIKDFKIVKTKKLLDDKIASDKRINKYKSLVIKASKIYLDYPNGVDVATAGIMKYKDTIYFVSEGFDDNLRDVYTLDVLKWNIIKKYIKLGYNKFNLGEVLTQDKKNKYYGIYLSKSSFNPKIYEYSGNYELVINKYLYTIFKNIFI